MRRFAPLALAATVVAGAFAGHPAQAQENAKTYAGRHPKHVVLMDWDGFDPDFLGRARTPNLDALVARGSLSIGRSTFQTVSNPARASMSTGAHPDVHENAAYYFDPSSNTARGQERFLAAETIAEVLAEGRTLASVQWYMVQNHGATYGVRGPGERGHRHPERRPVDLGGQSATVPKIPDFLAVYSDALDALAHREGAESPNIAVLLAEMDRQIGRLLQATKDVGIYGQTAFILTTHHGMTSWNQTLIPEVLAAIAAKGVPPRDRDPGSSITVTDVSRAFFLDGSYLPRASFIDWHGSVTLSPAQPAARLWARGAGT